MSRKIINISSLSSKIKKIKGKRKVVLCHGVFDVLHIGHINHFKSAKIKGDILVVSVTPDRYVNKGPNRPVFPLNIRMQSIAALKDVDFVTANISNTAIYPILNLKPDFYCKGKDYLDNKADVSGNIQKELRAIKSIGGKIHYTQDELYSSSKIINNLGLNLKDDQKNFIKYLKKEKNINITNTIKAINSFSDLKVLIIGETIIDEYVYCDALGKSGKEPVLVVKKLNSKKFLGGTLAIANNLSSFCKKISVISYIGEKKEELGFIKKNIRKNIKLSFLNKKNSCTIVKKRYVDEVNKTKVLGVYSIEDNYLNTKEEKLLKKNIIKEINKHDIVIISDYGHGLISKKIAKEILKRAKFSSVNAQVNAANIGHHTISKYLKPNLAIINENEMRHEMRNKSEKLDVLIKSISKKINSNYTAVTSGNTGMKMFSMKSKKLHHCPAFAKNIVDKIGAGDTMLALLSLCVFKKLNSKLSMFISSLAAATNVQTEANSLILDKTSIIKSAESYLK